MQSPDFWWRERSLSAALLAPAGWIQGRITARRQRQAARYNSPIPVICIGNFTVGGTGKTPTAIEVGHLLKELGLSPTFLSRGYGGAMAGPILVDPKGHLAEDVGDEPLLLARTARTIVARDRIAGVQLAESLASDCVIMDDGFQNPSLAKDLTIVVVDGQSGFGNGAVLPAGPLRAPLQAQYPLADFIVVAGLGRFTSQAVRQAARHGKPVVTARIVPVSVSPVALKGARVLAYAGIGRPEKFFRTLQSIGAVIVETRSYADHHMLSEKDCDDILRTALENRLLLVTTRKDTMRLSGHQDIRGELLRVSQTLDIKLEFDNRELLKSTLRRVIEKARS